MYFYMATTMSAVLGSRLGTGGRGPSTTATRSSTLGIFLFSFKGSPGGERALARAGVAAFSNEKGAMSLCNFEPRR